MLVYCVVRIATAAAEATHVVELSTELVVSVAWGTC